MSGGLHVSPAVEGRDRWVGQSKTEGTESLLEDHRKRFRGGKVLSLLHRGPMPLAARSECPTILSSTRQTDIARRKFSPPIMEMPFTKEDCLGHVLADHQRMTRPPDSGVYLYVHTGMLCVWFLYGVISLAAIVVGRNFDLLVD